MLESIVKMYRRYLAEDPVSEEYARFVESLDDLQWSTLLERIPSEIADADPASFGEFDAISVRDLEGLIN